MKSNSIGFLLVALVALSVGCTRPASEDFSTLRLQIPESSSQDKAGILSALPSNRKACFGVSITGAGVTETPARTCSPKTGVIAGFVENGGSLEVLVPKGTQRRIELFAFLQDVGASNPCPTFTNSFTPQQLKNTYIIGAVVADLLAASETVEILANFPGLDKNIAQQNSMPAACVGPVSGQNLLGFGISSARHLATASGVKLLGRVGRAEENKVLTGSGIKLYVRK